MRISGLDGPSTRLPLGTGAAWVGSYGEVSGEAVRRYLAWESILGEREPLDLSPHQVKQAEIQKEAASSAVTARLPEAYQWLLVPGQTTPDAPIEWLAMRLSGQDSLAARASKKLKGDELLVTGFAATRLRMELDRVPLWRGDHVSIKQIVEDFARYLYLPRVCDPTVLLRAISDGAALLTLGARCVCDCGQLRRRGEAISWVTWCTGRFRCRMPMRPGCSSSRMSRDGSSTPRAENRMAQGLPAQWVETARIPVRDRIPERLHRTSRPPLGPCGSMGRCFSTRPAQEGTPAASQKRSSRIFPAWWAPRSR